MPETPPPAAGKVPGAAQRVPPADMAQEGITEAELTAFVELHSPFMDIKSASREALMARSGATERLARLFTEAGTLVKGTLDRLAVQYKKKDPEFYLKYKAARNIVYRRAQKPAENSETLV
jgi:hypothetical protein